MSKNQPDLSEKLYTEEEKSKNQQEPKSPDESYDDTKALLDVNGKESQSSLSYASFNYINSIIGSGVIGIPYAFQQAGFGLGFFLLIFVAMITDYSLVLMIRSGHLTGVFSYQGVMEAAFGQPGFVLLSILQFIYPFIAMVSYNVVVGDTVTKVFIRVFKLDPTSLFSQREVVIGLATLFVTLPLCLYKDLTRLAKVSLFSLVCVGFILLVIVAEFFMLYDIVPTSEDSWSFINWNVIPAVGIMTFAFMCHHNTFLIYGSIKDADQRKWDSVTHISLTISFLIAALFGVVGYSTFTGYSQGDLLENYCPDDDLISAARIFFSITILLTYPIECLVTREIIDNCVFSNFDNTNTLTRNKHFYITFFLVLVTYLLSLTTDCLGIVLELNGVLAAVPLAYIIPALCYLKLEPSPLMSKEKFMSLGLLSVGVVVAILGLLFVVNDYKTLGNCSHGEVMDYCIKNITKVVKTQPVTNKG